MEAVSAYVEGALVAQYLDLLPSRWAALLPRMAKTTQRLQTSSDITAATELTRNLEDEFHLASALLRAEHDIYEKGILLLSACSDGCVALQQAGRVLFNDVLADLTAKEMMLAHWQVSAATISADTLRIYCHALLVHSRVTKPRAQQLAELAQSTELRT